MRSETEIFNLLLKYAADRKAIRAVVLNGSRVNPNARPDPYRDYDVVYFVTDIKPFRRAPSLVRYFGDPMIVQLPEEMGDNPPEGDGSYAYLMQFMDGSRIDLTFAPLSSLDSRLKDSLTKVLLDKDSRIGRLPPPSEESYLPKKPTQKRFDDCCNEFWWVNPYVAKGLLRKQLPYARHMLDVYVRKQLMIMLVWYAGVRTGFKVSTGKCGGRLRELLDMGSWRLLERTYVGHRESSNWDALGAMEVLFRRGAKKVGKAFGFRYPDADDRRVSAYIRSLRASSEKRK